LSAVHDLISQIGDPRLREWRPHPAHRVGRMLNFRLSEVDEWVRVGGADEDSERRNVDRTAAPEAGTGQAGEKSIEARNEGKTVRHRRKRGGLE